MCFLREMDKMSLDRAVGGSFQSPSTRLIKTEITDHAPILKNQQNSTRVLKRKILAFSHFIDVYQGEHATRFLFFPVFPAWNVF